MRYSSPAKRAPLQGDGRPLPCVPQSSNFSIIINLVCALSTRNAAKRLYIPLLEKLALPLQTRSVGPPLPAKSPDLLLVLPLYIVKKQKQKLWPIQHVKLLYSWPCPTSSHEI